MDISNHFNKKLRMLGLMALTIIARSAIALYNETRNIAPMLSTTGGDHARL